ncbi:MAG: tetratricopeptide repeat protein [Candidatus Zhuqueibacterota bacterium]
MQKSLKEEVKYLEGKLDKNPTSILFARLADMYLQSDRLEDAITMCEKGIKKYPYYVTGHYILGKCYLRKKLFDQAEKELKRVLLFDPKYIAAHRDYGELMAQIGWNNTCEMSYEEILRIDPFNDKARQRLEELREQLALTPEPKRDDNNGLEFDEVEESILTGVTTTLDEPKTAPQPKEPQVADPLEGFGDSDIMFEDMNDHDPDVNASIDILDDIFSDEKLENFELKEVNFPKPEPERTFRQEREEEPMDVDATIETEPAESPEDDEVFGLVAEEPTNGVDDQNFKEHDFDKDPMVREEFHELNENEFQAIMDDEPLDHVDSDSDNEFEMFPGASNKRKSSTPAEDRYAAEKKKERIVTPTLGEIYAAQHQYSKAIGVYEILRKKDPNNQLYIKKIEYLQQKLEESQSE